MNQAVDKKILFRLLRGAMQLTLEQVLEMAPDGSSAAAGKKLMALKNWNGLGRSEESLWGLCQGSAVYQVKVDFSNLGYHCSCPSRKFPCKHVLGLLLLWAQSPAAVAEAETPPWMSEWLSRRKQREEKKAERQENEAKKPVDEKAQQKRAAQRESRIADGLERLDLWIKDLVRGGLAGVETKPSSFWEEQSRRLVDAQAPGLASRVARLSAIPRSSNDWPSRLLFELGRLKLLLHAWKRFDALTPPLQSDVKQILGFNVGQEDLEREGEQVHDCWLVVGQWVDDEDRIRTQRSWLVGTETKRMAIMLQFAPGNQGFAESIIPGTRQESTLIFYPGALRQRAKFHKREGNVLPISDRPPGAATIDDFLTDTARSLALQPWMLTCGTILRDVTILPREGGWLVRDCQGQALPLTGMEPWKMLAITAGRPFDLAGEWNGHRLKPLGFYINGVYRSI
jgi:hypothetical protein